MQGKCFGLVRGRVMRATRLDGCGRIASSGCSVIVSDGFVSISVTSRTSEGEAIEVTNASGKKCISDTPPPTFDGFGLEVLFCNVDPLLYSMFTGQEVVWNSAGEAVGFRVNTKVDASKSGVALEVWSDVPNQACDPNNAGAQGSWGYQLFPFMQGGVLGDYTIENGAVTFTITGMNTKSGGAWGTGPYDVIDGASGAAPLATALDADDHLHMELTSVAPPEPGCNCVASGPPATSASSGTPGTWSPVDSYPPADLDALQASSITATPTTAWTTGQYVVLGDGSRAKWSGTAWVAA